MGVARDRGRRRRRGQDPLAHASFRIRRPVRLLNMTSTLRFGPAWLVLMIAAAGTSTASAQIAASAASTAQGPSTPPPSTTPSPQSTSIPEHDTAPCDRYGVSTVVRCIGHDLGGM